MAKRFTALFFLAAIMCFMCWAVGSYGAKKAEDLLSGKNATASGKTATEYVSIDWAELYPFDDSGDVQVKSVATERKKSAYDFVKEKCEEYTSHKLLGYHGVIEAVRAYEKVIGWNVANIMEYNGVVKLRDGYFTTFTEKREVGAWTESIIEFSRWCKDRGIEFFYGNLPVKVCKYEDADISGSLDFANQNADELLAGLAENGVKYLDFRELLHEDGMRHHEAFYRTDHHWKAETGLWAARHILEYLRKNCGWNVEPEVLAPEKFRYETYPEWFLGSQGKKVTLSKADPEDIELIYPKSRTLLKFTVPTQNRNLSGDFSIIYEMAHIERKDYYHSNPYAAYKYADQPLTSTHNLLKHDGRRILVVHDSFANCVIPFLALDIEYTDEIDLRHFTGSLRKFIAGTKPDAVVVMYHCEVPGRPDVFDFR